MGSKTADTDRVRALIDAGAQVIEVLPESAWRAEHLPGARNIPLPHLRAEAVADLDPAAPTVVYCYDHECDLSARGAARLVALGFADVYDYADSKTAWLGLGLHAGGDTPAEDRAGRLARAVPTCHPEATIRDVADVLAAPETVVVAVVDAANIVVGALHPQAAALPPDTAVLAAADPGPATVRPSITRYELARSMDQAGQHHILVSTSAGRLVGLLRRAELG